MKIKYILVVLILLIIPNTVTAGAITIEKSYSSDGIGFWELYNDNGGTQINYYYSTCDTPLYFKYYMTTYQYSSYNSKNVYYFTPHTALYSNHDSGAGTSSFSHTVIDPSTTSAGISVYTHAPDGRATKSVVYVSNAIINDSTISGNFSCITSVDFFIKDGDDDYILTGTDSSSPYSFNTLTGFTYKLIFSDGHEYEFLCDGNEIYNYDACTYTTLNFRDNCGNLLPETWGRWYTPNESFSNLFHTSSGSYDILYDNPDYLELQVFSAIGKLYYNITNPQQTSYTILNDKIAWTNGIYVRDGNTSMALEDVLVTLSQDCIIDSSLYPSRNKYTDSGGIVFFDQCELDSFYLSASLTGYKPINNEYVSMIHSNAQDITQTTMLELYPIDDPINESALTESGTIATTYIYFKDNSSHYTNSILDTDKYVDLYYYNNNSESASMTLKFQKYNIYTGLSDILSWNIPHDTSGYKRIYNTNYTNYTYSYYGYLYNVEIDGWNRRARLSVRNETIEIINYYQNLSTILWFLNKNSEGNIDYREDMNIIAYANSDNSSLLEISLELYNNSIYVDHTNLSWADFVSADTKYYYEWNPDHSYVNGYNYTVDMRGYDYYLLETDYINAGDYRKNKLTIIVKDWIGNNLTNSYIYLEGYGSLSTGINYYNSYEGLDNAEYRYKASKSGYSDYGWDIINLDSSDEIVIYTLTGYDSTDAVISEKIDDTELSTVFYTLIFFLFIVILIAALNWLCIKCK